MAIGELGLLMTPAVSLVEEELKLTPEFATIQHHQMVEQHALVLLQKVFLAKLMDAPLVSQQKSDYIRVALLLYLCFVFKNVS
jgi:hypothetical protein